MSTVSIALVDDHRVVARSLKAYLESFPDLKVVGMAATGEELLEHLQEWRPQVVLQDLLIPGGMDGIETTRRILERAPSTRVIALTASTDEARMMGVLRAGAAGYVRKDAEPEILLAAVRSVARGKTYIDPSVSRQILQAAAPHDDLTPREVEVLRQLALGCSNKEITGALSIGDETVKSHVGSVLSKLQVDDRAQVIAQWTETCRHLTGPTVQEVVMPGAIGDANGVDLNSASEQELGKVGGIGPERARRLVEARPFHSWDDLKRVEGFSDKLVEDLRQAGATLGGQTRQAGGK